MSLFSSRQTTAQSALAFYVLTELIGELTSLLSFSEIEIITPIACKQSLPLHEVTVTSQRSQIWDVCSVKDSWLFYLSFAADPRHYFSDICLCNSSPACGVFGSGFNSRMEKPCSCKRKYT